ncbi:MAG: tRNA pseudouridine(38-40) synthase TruA [Cyclobacteriaceae bacterium]|jgi:tRNA pseudouridine38-40 synthase|nr:tRNA pseudouridine(38-40) synthase TruA [Flammeovirgaceae bacterium]
MRFFFEISYNGTRYHGWQNQRNAVGVQQLVEEGLSKMFREKVAITGSGRTDTGVHCAQQFFHVDLEKEFQPEKLIQQLNSFLPADIAIGGVRQVKPDAHARYDARERTYEYHLTTRKNPLLVGRAFYCIKPLDFQIMNQAAELLLGEHDFESFSKVKTDVNHFICDLKSARWNQKGDLWVFTITANRFLRGMVRAVVGTLLDVGSGKITVNQFKQIVDGRDRQLAGMNVPAEGLYLVSVKYPNEIFLK